MTGTHPLNPHLILFNGRVHTLGVQQNAPAQAIALRAGEVLAVGSDQSVRALAGPQTEQVNLRGRTILPGLTDAHLHFEHLALSLARVDVGAPTKAEALQRVAARAATLPAGTWVVGHGWRQGEWDGAFPLASELDSAVPLHPVYLFDSSHHMAWVNSAALRASSIQASTADPAGGRISRDARGQADGMLFETACDLAYDKIPSPTPAQRATLMAAAQKNAWQVGLTGIHDFDRRAAFVAFQQLRAEHKLGLRVLKHVPVEQLDEAIALGLRSGLGDDWLRIGNIKIFIDGALGPRTASMLAPYENEAANTGMQLMDKEELADKASRASAAGLPITVHAIGDRANHDVLDVLEAVRREEAQRGETPAMRRHRIEHVQLLHAADAGRLGALGVVASMQPIHALGDMASAERYWGARCAGAYAWRTQLQAGAVLAFGSDAPIESYNPFYGLYAAVTRMQPDAAPGASAWYPEQRLTLAEALAGYTSGAAYAAGMEDRLGTLQPGWLADLIITDRDIFTCSAHELRATQVIGTVVGGEWKHRLPELD
ncbi:MAG: hypothetical protein RLY92_439 [Chloroflexota bacterium]